MCYPGKETELAVTITLCHKFIVHQLNDGAPLCSVVHLVKLAILPVGNVPSIIVPSTSIQNSCHAEVSFIQHPSPRQRNILSAATLLHLFLCYLLSLQLAIIKIHKFFKEATWDVRPSSFTKLWNRLHYGSWIDASLCLVPVGTWLPYSCSREKWGLPQCWPS